MRKVIITEGGTYFLPAGGTNINIYDVVGGANFTRVKNKVKTGKKSGFKEKEVECSMLKIHIISIPEMFYIYSYILLLLKSVLY